MSLEQVFPLPGGQFVVPGNRWDLVPPGPGATPEVSVVIPHYNNQADLDLVLAGLTAQTHPRSRLQVVIADDGSAAPPTIPHYARCLAPIVVSQEDRGFRAAAARNLGLRQADGQVMVFLDGDTVPEPSYVQRISRLPSTLPDALVGGRRRYAELSGWTGEQLLRWFEGAAEPPATFDEPEWLVGEYRRSKDLLDVRPRSFTYLIGAVLAASAQLVRELGGFDEAFVGYGGEDYDLAYRAWNAGAVLAHVPSALAWHNGTDWSGRMNPADGRRQKNVETMVLADLIPEPSFRGLGQLHSVPDVIVESDVATWDLGEAVLCIQSLLRHLDCQVALLGDGGTVAAVAAAFASDPRVRPGWISADVGGRARAVVELRAPMLVSTVFAAVVQDVLTRDGGGLTVRDGGRVVAEMTTTRADRRSRRWAEQWGWSPRRTASALFGWSSVEAAEVGLSAGRVDPTLSSVFGGWG